MGDVASVASVARGDVAGPIVRDPMVRDGDIWGDCTDYPAWGLHKEIHQCASQTKPRVRQEKSLSLYFAT